MGDVYIALKLACHGLLLTVSYVLLLARLHTRPLLFFQPKYGRQQRLNRRFPDDTLPPFENYPVRMDTVVTFVMWDSYLVSHFGNQFTKISHFLIDVNDVGPFFAFVTS